MIQKTHYHNVEPDIERQVNACTYTMQKRQKRTMRECQERESNNTRLTRPHASRPQNSEMCDAPTSVNTFDFNDASEAMVVETFGCPVPQDPI